MQTSPSNLIPACLIFAGLYGAVMFWCCLRVSAKPTPKPGGKG